MLILQNGDVIAGGGVPILHMTYADYLANQSALDASDVFVDTIDEPTELAYADEIGYGDTTLDYVGDIATQALGDVELTDTATKLHTVGSYFVNKAGKYCRTTVQINVGSTIVVGTNCVETDIGAEVKGVKDTIGNYGKVLVDAVLAVGQTVPNLSDYLFFQVTSWSSWSTNSLFGRKYPRTNGCVLRFSGAHETSGGMVPVAATITINASNEITAVDLSAGPTDIRALIGVL